MIRAVTATLFAGAALAAAACHHAKAPAPVVANHAPDPDATCDAAAGHYARLHVDELTEDVDRWRPRLATLVAKTCTEMEWNAAARNCYLHEGPPTDPREGGGDGEDGSEDEVYHAPPGCEQHLDEDQSAALFQATTTLSHEIDPPPPPPNPAKLAADTAAFETRTHSVVTGIVECDDYMRLMVGLLRCDKMPAEAKSAFIQGGNAMLDAMAPMQQLPPDARKAAADGCRAGLDAMKQASSSLGCLP